jgi:hypothetical protein
MTPHNEKSVQHKEPIINENRKAIRREDELEIESEH